MYQTTEHQYRYRSFAQLASLIATVTGAVAVMTWLLDRYVLAAMTPAWISVKFNAGLGLLLSGISLGLLSTRAPTPSTRRLSLLTATSSLLIGGLTAASYLIAGNGDGDPWIFFDQGKRQGVSGSMSLVSATLFILLGAALLLMARGAPRRWVEGLALLVMLNALVPPIGYLYGKTSLYQIPYYGTISLPVMLMLVLLCAGILAARPDCGLMKLLTNRSPGGMTARRLLPAALILPIVLARLLYWGYQEGLYDVTVSMILITLSSIVLYALLISWNSHLLLRLDEQRGNAQDALHQTLDILETNLQALSTSNSRLVAEASERRTAEERLFHEHERAQVTLNSIADGVITTDIDGRIVYMNPAAERMCGWPLGDAAGLQIHQVFHIVDPALHRPVTGIVSQTLADNTVSHLPSNSILIRRDGTESTVNDSCAPMHDSVGKVIGAVLVFQDVSALRAMSLRMSYLSQHDTLTDLPNRFLLNDRLAQAIALAQHRSARTALLFLDIDRFKHVNDTLAHAVGDRLLQEIAKRLKGAMRDTDTVSRYSGDEFAILLTEVSDGYGAARVAKQLLSAMTEPFCIDKHEIHITSSIGISVFPEDGEDADTIIRHAEAAMYQAKSQGRNNYQFFMRRINERAIKRFALEGSLRRAIAREESALFYQPKFSIAENRVAGAEALLRWNSRHGDSVPPAQFIPIAEESGLIIPMGEWALRKACLQGRAWQDAGYPAMPIAVNVSAVQFRDQHFVEMVARVLDETGLEPRYLELELTESVTMQDLERTATLLETLKKMGVGLSIDDFGTGYSSLSYLKRFPIDALKIDRSFVQDITRDPGSAAITNAIISMAKSLNQKVIAEGVETFEQFAFLRDHDCDQIQGFFFSAPLSAQDFEQRILRQAQTVM